MKLSLTYDNLRLNSFSQGQQPYGGFIIRIPSKQRHIWLLNQLCKNAEPTAKIMSELSSYGWDHEKELVILLPHHLIKIIDSVLEGRQTFDDLKEWAEAVELREDIGRLEGYEDILNEIVFTLANPEISSCTTEHELRNITLVLWTIPVS